MQRTGQVAIESHWFFLLLRMHVARVHQEDQNRPTWLNHTFCPLKWDQHKCYCSLWLAWDFKIQPNRFITSIVKLPTWPYILATATYRYFRPCTPLCPLYTILSYRSGWQISCNVPPLKLKQLCNGLPFFWIARAYISGSAGFRSVSFHWVILWLRSQKIVSTTRLEIILRSGTGQPNHGIKSLSLHGYADL